MKNLTYKELWLLDMNDVTQEELNQLQQNQNVIGVMPMNEVTLEHYKKYRVYMVDGWWIYVYLRLSI